MRLRPIEETLNLIEIKEKREQKCAITVNGFITVSCGSISALYARLDVCGRLSRKIRFDFIENKALLLKGKFSSLKFK